MKYKRIVGKIEIQYIKKISLFSCSFKPTYKIEYCGIIESINNIPNLSNASLNINNDRNNMFAKVKIIVQIIYNCFI